jgi:hypothetical protein
MFAPAYVGRKRRAKPLDRFYSFSESIEEFIIGPRTLVRTWDTWTGFGKSWNSRLQSVLTLHDFFRSQSKPAYGTRERAARAGARRELFRAVARALLGEGAVAADWLLLSALGVNIDGRVRTKIRP